MDWIAINTIASIAAAIVNFAVGLVILWYTVETSKLRKLAEKQVSLLESQLRSVSMPLLGITLANITSRAITGDFPVAIVIENLFRRVATEVRGFIYMAEEGTYLATNVRAYIRKNAQNPGLLPEGKIDFHSMLEITDSHYHMKSQFSRRMEELSIFKEPSMSAAFVFYKDMFGKSYLVTRLFKTDGKKIVKNCNFYVDCLY